MKLLSKTRCFYGICAFLTLSFVLSYAQADESSPSDPPSSTTPTSGCTTVTVIVNGGDWVPSATYQPCSDPKGLPDTWYLPWKVGEKGYSEQKSVVSGSPFIIGRKDESCDLAHCTTFTPTGDTFSITCDGCIVPSGLNGCPQSGGSTDSCYKS